MSVSSQTILNIKYIHVKTISYSIYMCVLLQSLYFLKFQTIQQIITNFKGYD